MWVVTFVTLWGNDDVGCDICDIIGELCGVVTFVTLWGNDDVGCDICDIIGE